MQSFVLGKSVDEPLQGLNTAGLADERMLEQFGGIPSLFDQHKRNSALSVYRRPTRLNSRRSGP